MIVQRLLILSLILLVSCGGGVSFIAVQELPQAQWRADQWVEFDFSEGEDKIDNANLGAGQFKLSQPQAIDIIVRHDLKFKYEKLLVEIRTIAPANPLQVSRYDFRAHDTTSQASHIRVRIEPPTRSFWCDTIAIPLFNSDKGWLGKSMTTHVDLATSYRRNVRFLHPGAYNIRIRQLHDGETLDGIFAIGLKIEKE